jgi:hypothetical protein
MEDSKMLKSKAFTLFSVICIQILTVSCNSRPGTNTNANADTATTGGSIHLLHITGNDAVNDPSVPGDTYLHYGNDERVTWKNDTTLDFYVCFSPSDQTQQPFHAIVWFVPAGQKRHSGKIRDDATMASTNVYYHVYRGPQLCTAPPISGQSIPKIIIQP